MGRRTILAAVFLAVAVGSMPMASADVCNGTDCPDGHGGGRPGRGGGSPGGTAGSFSINNASVTEGDAGPESEAFKKLVFTVTLTGGGAASVKFATQDGTTTSGSVCMPSPDYESKNGTLKFAGPGKKKVRITVYNDFCFEETENMFVNLSNPQGATIADGKGKGTIRDDDGQQTP